MTIRAVFDPFTVAPAFANVATGITSLGYTMRRNRRSDAAERSVSSRPNLDDHLAFQQAAVAVLHRLSYVSATGLPPSRLGVLWTWPASYRLTRDFPSAIEALKMTFSAAAVTGPEDLLDPSAAVFEAIGETCASFTPRRSGKEAFTARLNDTYEELGRYTALLRKRASGAEASDPSEPHPTGS